jgi:MFS family permease
VPLALPRTLGRVTGDVGVDPPIGDRRRSLQIGLVAVVTLVAFESLAVTTILPEIEGDLGGVAWYGWVTSAFFLGTMIGIVFAGDQADRRGAGRPYVIGLVLFAVGLVLGGLAPTMPTLVVARFVQGLGAGVVPAIGYVAIGRAFSVQERPRMFAILSTAWVVPGLVGPVLAERIAQGVGWRWVFLGLIPLVIAAGVAVVPAMMRIGPSAYDAPPPVPFLRRRLVEAVRVAVGTALLVSGLTFDRLFLVPAVAVGLVIGLGPLRRLTPPGTLRAAPGLPAVIASRGAITFVFFGLDAFVPYALTSGRDRSTLMASVAVTLTTVSWTIGAWIQQRWIAGLGEAWFVRTGYLLLAPGVGLAAVAALLDGAPFWLIHVGGVGAGLGMGFAYSAHAQLTFRSVDEREVGAATASLQLCDNLGIALGTGVVGAVVALGDDLGWAPGAAVAIAWVVPVAVAASGAMLSRRLPHAADDVSSRAPRPSTFA